MTQDNTELLPVTQEDREAATDVWSWIEILSREQGDDILAGKWDESGIVQAFARHRLNTRPNQGHDALVEAACRRMAAVDGLDWDEQCAREIDDDNECESCTCVAALNEDHDPDDMRSWFRSMARAALTNLPTPQAEEAPSDGPTSLQNMQTSPDALVEELRAELEAIQGPKKGDDEHPAWLSTLLNVCQDIEDEGDRVYFGSTNDADALRDVVEALEQAHHPLHLFRRPDLHRHNSELRKLNEAQAARIAELADEKAYLSFTNPENKELK